ncbi:MAG: hypothetical protein AB1393_14420 [Candidatus Edwardsbacteria bacterium]
MSRNLLETIVKNKSITYPILLDTLQTVQTLYEIDKLPCLILIDHRGIIRLKKIGYQKEETSGLKTEIERLLAIARDKRRIAIGTINCSEKATSFYIRTYQIIIAEVEKSANFILVEAGSAEYQIEGNITQIGNQIAVDLTLVDIHTKIPKRTVSEGATEEKFDKAIIKLVRELLKRR